MAGRGEGDRRLGRRLDGWKGRVRSDVEVSAQAQPYLIHLAGFSNLLLDPSLYLSAPLPHAPRAWEKHRPLSICHPRFANITLDPSLLFHPCPRRLKREIDMLERRLAHERRRKAATAAGLEAEEGGAALEALATAGGALFLGGERHRGEQSSEPDGDKMI